MKFVFLKNYLNRKLFNKIFLIYAAIIVLSLLALSVFITANITQTLQQKELNANLQTLDGICSYLDQKCYSSLSMIQQVYANNDVSSDLVYFMKHEYGDYLSHRLDEYSSSPSSTLASYQKYFNTFFIRDSDIDSIVLYSSVKDFFYVGDEKGPRLHEFDPSVKKLVDELTESRRQYYPYLLSGSSLSPSSDRKVFSTIISVNDPDTLERIGALIINYKLDSSDSTFQKYLGGIKGSILILTSDGSVLFDSAGRYYGSEYPYAGRLEGSTGSSLLMLDEKSWVNTKKSLNSGVLVAGIIPERQISAGTAATRRTILLISFLLIFISLVLTYFIVQIFSRRTRLIMQGMEELRKGNLSARIAIGRNEDELAQIAVNFNSMCDSLNDYISRVYLSEIKQKNAELMALQSQINPHFLYNTLEVVRMKAVSSGAANVANMVYILATLFRNSIKGETFIPISAELEMCSLYLELFRIRYEGRLTFNINVDSSIMNFRIVKFTLQPIIENYILHGIRQDSDNNAITISAELYSGDIHFIISDNGVGIDSERLESLQKMLKDNIPNPGSAIGLPNVNERLRLIYGSGYGVEITSEQDVGTSVSIKIPARRKEELDEYVRGFPCR